VLQSGEKDWPEPKLPEVAVTIPKRCNIADRPVGFKCGGQFYMLLPFTHPFLVLFSPAPLTGGQ